eukprot:Rmarinus@m.20763
MPIAEVLRQLGQWRLLDEIPYEQVCDSLLILRQSFSSPDQASLQAFWEDKHLQTLLHYVRKDIGAGEEKEDCALISLVNVTVLETQWRKKPSLLSRASDVSVLLDILDPKFLENAHSSDQQLRVLHRNLCVSRIFVHLGVREDTSSFLSPFPIAGYPTDSKGRTALELLCEVVSACLNLLFSASFKGNGRTNAQENAVTEAADGTAIEAMKAIYSLLSTLGHGRLVRVGCSKLFPVLSVAWRAFGAFSEDTTHYTCDHPRPRARSSSLLSALIGRRPSTNASALSYSDALSVALRTHTASVLSAVPLAIVACWCDPKGAMRAAQRLKPGDNETDAGSSDDQSKDDLYIPLIRRTDEDALDKEFLHHIPLGGFDERSIVTCALRHVRCVLDRTSDAGTRANSPEFNNVLALHAPAFHTAAAAARFSETYRPYLFAAVFGKDNAVAEFGRFRGTLSDSQAASDAHAPSPDSFTASDARLLEEATQVPLEERVLSLLTGAPLATSNGVGEFLYEACGRDVNRLIRFASIQRIIGFLVNKGLMQAPQQQSMSLEELRDIRDELRRRDGN